MGKYVIRKGVPVPSSARGGLSAAIRRMSYGDCITIPLEQYMSVHTCARSVGAKVRTQSNKDGTVNVWRIDSPPAAEVGPSSAATEPEPVAQSQSSGESPTFFWPDWDSVKTIFD